MCLPNLIHFMAILPIVDETLQCGLTDGDCHHKQTCSEKSEKKLSGDPSPFSFGGLHTMGWEPL